MTMPVLPALMNQDTAAAAPSLADILGGLDELAMGELVASAEAAGFGGDGEAADEDGEEPAEEEAADEEVEDVEAEPEEADVEEVAAKGFESMTSWVASAREALDPQLEALQAAFDTATAGVDEGADPDSIEPLIEKATELCETADVAVEEANAAAEAQDAHACAIAALRVERIGRVISKMVEQAATFAETTAAPEAGFDDEPAVKLWAERTSPKAGPLGI
jgi:hypothetical protein